MVITSPSFVRQRLAMQSWADRAVVLFSNDPNQSMFDGLKDQFLLRTEQDVMDMLPSAMLDR